MAKQQESKEESKEQKAMMQELQELRQKDYLNSMRDELTFRIIMIQNLQAMNIGIQKLNETIKALSSDGSKEDKEDKDDSEEDEDSEEEDD